MGLLEELKEQLVTVTARLNHHAGRVNDLAFRERDLVAAIAALTPAPEAHPGSGHGEIEGDALAEFMKREGAVKWDQGDMPVPRDTIVEVVGTDGRVHRGEAFCFVWSLKSEALAHARIIAYRVLPSEPTSEAAEGYAHVVGEGTQSARDEIFERDLISDIDPLSISASETHAAESDAVKAISLDQMDDAGITDPAASAMARMLSGAQAAHVRKGWPL